MINDFTCYLIKNEIFCLEFLGCYKINSLKQNGISLSYYFNKLDSLWKEFDGLTSLTECTCDDSIKLKDHSNLMKLMQFLSGLDDSYSHVKSHIF